MFFDYYNYAAAIRVMILALPGGGALWLAERIGRRVKTRTGRVLFVWPFLGLGYFFFAAAALQMLWNMIGPLVVGE